MKNVILSKQKIAIRIAIIAMAFFPIALFANVPIGGIVSQSLITSPSSQCNSNADYAMYEGQGFIGFFRQTPNDLTSSREYFPNTNVKIYNPGSMFGDLSGQNTLGGKLPTFTYKSNGRPGTTQFNFAGIPTTYVYKQDNKTYVIAPSPSTSRTTMGAQIVHDFFRKAIQSRGGNPYTMTALALGSTTPQTFTATPSVWYSMQETVKCQNFYIAKCGDGIIDSPNKSADISTDGLSGILVGTTMVNWRNTGFDAEICDDGPLNGTAPEYCDTNCGRGNGAPMCGDKIINDGDLTLVGHGPTYFSGGVEMIEQCDDGPRDDTVEPPVGNNSNYQLAACAGYCEKNTEPEQLPEELGQ